jgi:EAL domain-containing protein (putative c-di-GMP-specific phosphodiesterase class I)
LRDALRDNSFQVLFQPFLDLHDRERENYEMRLRLRTDAGDQIGTEELLPVAREGGLLRHIDRWIAGRALDVLDERRQAGGELRLLIAQSLTTLADPDFAHGLREELRRRLSVGTGLVLEFTLADSASDLKRTRTLIAELKHMGVGVCLSRFGHNDTSYKLLQFLGAEYIKIGEKLLDADPLVSNTLVDRVHQLGARVILPRVGDSGLIGRHWLSVADAVQSDAFQGA